MPSSVTYNLMTGDMRVSAARVCMYVCMYVCMCVNGGVLRMAVKS